MKMFDKKDMKERIGDMKKVSSLKHLEPIEEYFLERLDELKMEQDYDVVANELPYFKTFSYTEIGHSFFMYPLQQELRVQQLNDAYEDSSKEVSGDWVAYFRERALEKGANKYTHIKSHNIEPRPHLIIPVGSNKLKDTVCLNKIFYIINTYGRENIYFKPHPLTTHQLVGEMKDRLGEEVVLERDADMYSLIAGAETIHTTHMSESAIYAVCLDKTIDPIDVYNVVHRGSYYPISRNLFNSSNPKKWIQKAFSSYKSGIVNPDLDHNWREKVDKYLDYMLGLRENHRYQFVYTTGG